MAEHPSRWVLLAVSLCVVLVSGGCSPPGQQGPSGSAASPPPQQLPPPIATLADGTEITLELALTQEELATGLMFRPTLAPDRGMLLLFSVERYPSIWMKNTMVSLDLLFLDDNGTVVDIEPGVPPCAADPCPTYAASEPARAVLEIAAGGVERYGIAIGDVLTFERVPGFPVSSSEF